MSQSSVATKQLAEKFFRREYARMVATLVKFLGPGQVALAEDMVQETLLEAMKEWEYKGIPDQPQAWLYKVAHNKTLNYLKQEKNRGRLRDLFLKKDPENWPQPKFDNPFIDDQLTMMFVCCHPAIPQKAQIAMMLKTLCGLSIVEIANAFLSTPETINKRLVRARKVLRKQGVNFELPPEHVSHSRLKTVLKTLLLLFNEGYSSTQGDQLLKEEFCLEAIRLAEIILESKSFQDISDVHALLALMYFNVSRFNTRTNKIGELLELAQQDRSQWNSTLIQLGLQHLDKIQESQELSYYKIAATIAAHHSTAVDYTSTPWEAILKLYDILLKMDPSPLVKINRAVALSQARGYEQGLTEMARLDLEALVDYQFYYAVMGEFNLKLQHFSVAREYFEKAVKLAVSEPQRNFLIQKMAYCKE